MVNCQQLQLSDALDVVSQPVGEAVECVEDVLARRTTAATELEARTRALRTALRALALVFFCRRWGSSR